VVGSCDRDNEASVSIKEGKLFDRLSDYQILKDSAPWSKLLS
jgi:hypothetical protein